MIANMDNTESDIPLFNDAVKKFKSCDKATEFNGHKSCNIFHKKMDSNMDILNYCGSCLANNKNPSTIKIKTRA